MDQVFAPWRIEWVERDGDGDAIGGCPFCVLPERDDDRASRVVARSERAFVLLNNYPYNPGHVMVIPRVHEGEYSALEDATLLDHARLNQRTMRALGDALDPAGLNAGMNLGGSAAGGPLDDPLHTHVVPRLEGGPKLLPLLSATRASV